MLMIYSGSKPFHLSLLHPHLQAIDLKFHYKCEQFTLVIQNCVHQY